MGRFNSKEQSRKARVRAYATHPAAQRSHQGGIVYKQTPEMELYLQVCTMMFGDKYYAKNSTEQERMRKLIGQCDRKFVLQLAAFARNEMKMRSAPQMLLAEASVMHSGNPGESKADVREYASKIIRRADEPGEVLAYWLNCLGNGSKRKLPNALRKGIADSLAQFDEYQFDKYNRDSAEVKLKDVIQLVHPKPADEERAALYHRILDGTLNPQSQTWEKAMSAAGQVGASKKDTWNKVAPQMGLMALLRNIRNFQQEGANAAVEHAISQFVNAERVQKSRMLPMRWYQAHQAATGGRVKDALAEGLELSLANLPKISGNIAVVTDTSASMRSSISDKSTLTAVEVGGFMSAMATHLVQPGSEYTIGHFADGYEEIDVSRRDSVLTNVNKVTSRIGRVGHGTNANAILEDWISRRKVVDHFLLFSDMQVAAESRYYGHSLGYGRTFTTFAALWDQYRREVNPNATLYSFDLCGYGKGQLTPDGERRCYKLAGFSEKVFDFLEAAQNAGDAVEAIKANY